jgi:hypothetical protein
MKKKYWIAIGEHSNFTKDDHHIFWVFHSDQPNGKGYPLDPKFVEADELESARKAMHAFVDEKVDHVIHMANINRKANEYIGAQKKAIIDDIAKSSDSMSLSISGPRNDATSRKTSTCDISDAFNDLLKDSK